MEKSTAKSVYEWLDEHPYVSYVLKKDLINFSSLARAIQKELSIKKFDAVIVAVRRYQREMSFERLSEESITKLLKKSRLEITTGVNVYIAKPDAIRNIEKSKYLHLIKGSSAVTVITREKLDVDYIKAKENMLEVKIVSPTEIENNLGFMAYVCSALAEKGIVIVETYGCYTDTIFIFGKNDLLKVVEVMQAIGVK